MEQTSSNKWFTTVCPSSGQGTLNFVCHLPFASGMVFSQILADQLEGSDFVNALKLLRTEFIEGTMRITAEVANLLRVKIGLLEIDNTRRELLNAIIGYLRGANEARVKVIELLQGEGLLSGSATDAVAAGITEGSIFSA